MKNEKWKDECTLTQQKNVTVLTVISGTSKFYCEMGEGKSQIRKYG